MSAKAIFGFLLLLMTVFWVVFISDCITSNYRYEQQFSSNWSLADKASTLDQKSDYINKFVTSLESSGMQGSYNAIWFSTPDNSFDSNLQALKSLQSRMTEIRGMNEKSFEYQQAISQITAQEQGEARKMLEVFEGCWYLHNHFLLWDWVGTTILIIAIFASLFLLIGILVVCLD